MYVGFQLHSVAKKLLAGGLLIRLFTVAVSEERKVAEDGPGHCKELLE